MNQLQAKKEIEQLSKELEEHNHKYYVLSAPTISDKEYDDLLKRLIVLEDQFPKLRLKTSPTQRIGTKLDAGIKNVNHRVKMYSLDNTYSVDEIKDWHQRVVKGLKKQNIEYTVELKIDGVSTSLTYNKGEFVLGATRGDGTFGEDVTHCLKTIQSVPLKMIKTKNFDIPNILDVRAEIYMKRKDFEDLNKERKQKGEDLFVNPRNATSGSIKLLDARITAQRKLSCFVHSFGVLEGGKKLQTQWEFLHAVKEWGFTTDPHSRLCPTIDDVIKYCQEFQNKRDSIVYDIDGVVIKVNSLEDQKKLGATLKSPRWSVAYKFPAQQATTKVKEITVQVGRTGVLTPVAELEPVFCGGVTISRATLHNFDEIERLNINVGDKVLVERAGDVIPKIVKVVNSSHTGKKNNFKIPVKCPECQSSVVKEKSQEVAYRCVNPQCPKIVERSLIHYSSRGAMDIEGMGESVVVQLLSKGLLKDVADIYYLKRDDLLSLELFKDKKADNLLRAIEESKKKPLSKLLFGLGVEHVGEKAAYLLAQHYGNLNKLMSASFEDIEQIHEIGPTMAESIVDYFKRSDIKKVLNKLGMAGVNFVQPNTQKSNKLSNKKFVFTGELVDLSREEASELVKKMGGEVVSSVSKKTDYVVAGDSAGSKYEKAKELGVNILTEQQFKELVHE